MTLSVRIFHRFPGFELDIDFDTPSGITVLFGRSGSGKTTVANAIAGILQPDKAKIAIDGEVLSDTSRQHHVAPHKRRIGYVFQDARLFPHMSVAANLEYGRRFNRQAESVDAREIIRLLDLGALIDRKPMGLSGGERQRVAIGRAVLSAPRLLVMDEPLASLDEMRKQEILPYLERLRDREVAPIVYISHAVPEVARLATSVVVMENGKISEVGSPEAFLSNLQMPPAMNVREAGSLLSGTVIAHHEDGLSELQISGGNLLLPRLSTRSGAKIRVRIQATDIILASEKPVAISALNILPVTVTGIRKGEGPGVMVQLACGADRLLARVTLRSAQRLELKLGASCYAIFKSVAPARVDIGT